MIYKSSEILVLHALYIRVQLFFPRLLFTCMRNGMDKVGIWVLGLDSGMERHGSKQSIVPGIRHTCERAMEHFLASGMGD